MAKGVEEFWKILHPNIEEIKYSDSGDRMLILRHLDEINKDYDEITNGYRINGLKIDERKIVKGIVDHYRIEEYFELLYPGYSKMSVLKRAELGPKKSFMQRHVDVIKEMYYKEAFGKEWDIGEDKEREILQSVVSKVEKADEYFQFLHPNYDQLSTVEKDKLEPEFNFLVDNIDYIDKEYRRTVMEKVAGGVTVDNTQSGKIIRSIVEEKKAIITVGDVGKALGMQVDQPGLADLPGADRPEGPDE